MLGWQIDASGTGPFDVDLRNFTIAPLAQEFFLIYGRWVQGHESSRSQGARA